MTIHNLKIKSQYFDAVKNGTKTFEIRYNDRDFKVGDTLILKEVDMMGEFTGNEIHKVVTYILPGPCYGLEDKFVIMSIK